MRSLLHSLYRSCSSSQQLRCLSTASAPVVNQYPSEVGGVHYQEGDRVVVTNKDGKRVKSRLMSPLKPEGVTRTGLHSYEIKHSDIIGKPAGRLYIQAPSSTMQNKTSSFRVAHPSLEQFIALVPRTVTPIYSSYGATIITLLDIHVAPPLPSNDPETSDIPRLEILEAGTGNGGLTLHLARSIASANLPPPQFPQHPSDEEVDQDWRQWRSKRRAIIHTVDFQPSRSRAAEKLIRSFRGALYWPHIDFHSGDVGAWVKEESKLRCQTSHHGEGFLDIVILDLPAVHRQIQHVVMAMKEDAQLLVWVPQVTQVAACQYEIEKLDLPLKLDQVVELGEGISNGKRWDLRFVKPRAEQKSELEKAATEAMNENSLSESNYEEADVSTPTAEEATKEGLSSSGADFPTMVCRPMVGEITMGGGFVGLWRKVTKPKPSKEDVSRATEDCAQI